jgi:hypothetical protein
MDVNGTNEAGPRDAGTTNAGFAEQRGRLGILREKERPCWPLLRQAFKRTEDLYLLSRRLRPSGP